MTKSWVLAVALSWTCLAQQVPATIPQSREEVSAQLQRQLRGLADQHESAITREPERPTGESVSVYRLQHKAPKAAEKSLERAKKLLKSGDHAGAAAELERAVQIDPLSAAAYNQLGAEYGQLWRLNEAKRALERAVELDPDFWSAHYNLGLVQFLLGDAAGAEQSARHALRVASEEAKPHLLLGYLLYPHEATRAEGLEHLQYAARTIKEVRQLLRAIPEK